MLVVLQSDVADGVAAHLFLTAVVLASTQRLHPFAACTSLIGVCCLCIISALISEGICMLQQAWVGFAIEQQQHCAGCCPVVLVPAVPNNQQLRGTLGCGAGEHR
jgi:hypothetical protein